LVAVGQEIDAYMETLSNNLEAAREGEHLLPASDDTDGSLRTEGAFRTAGEGGRTEGQEEAKAEISAELSFGLDDECAICYEDMKAPRKLPCGHWFCARCIDQLCEHQVLAVCPKCRARLDHPDGGELFELAGWKYVAVKRSMMWRGLTRSDELPDDLQVEMDELMAFLYEAADLNSANPFPLARMACAKEGGRHSKAQFVVEAMYYLKIIELAVALMIALFVPLVVIIMALLHFYRTIWWALVVTEGALMTEAIFAQRHVAPRAIISALSFCFGWFEAVRDFVVFSLREITVLGMPPVPSTAPMPAVVLLHPGHMGSLLGRIHIRSL